MASIRPGHGNRAGECKTTLDSQHLEVPPERFQLPPRGQSPDYQPLPLRWPFLVATAVGIASLIAIVAVACVVLPAEVDRAFVPGSKSAVGRAAGGDVLSQLPPKAYRGLLQPRDTPVPSPTPAFTPAPTASPVTRSITVLTAPVSTVDGEEKGRWGIDDPVEDSEEEDKPWGGLGIPVVTSQPATPTTKARYTSKRPCDDFWDDEDGKVYMTPGGSEVSLRFGKPVSTVKGAYSIEIILPTTTITSTTILGGCSVSKGGQSPEAFATADVWTVEQWDDDIPWTNLAAKSTPAPPPTTAPEAFAELTAAVTAGGLSRPAAAKDTASEGLFLPIGNSPGWRPTTYMGRTSMTVLASDASGVASTVVTLRDTSGTPTATFLGIMVGGMSAYVQASVITLGGSAGAPAETVTMLLGDDTPSYIRAAVLTMTDSNGVPIATITSTPRPISTPTVITLTDSKGVPIETVTTSVLAAPRTTTLTDVRGVATATFTEYPTYPSDPPTRSKTMKVYKVSKAAYFVGFFLPPIVSGLLTIPIRMIDLSAKQYQPWHELTRVTGAIADDSLCLRTGGMYGIMSSIYALIGGQALVFLTTLLTLCSVALVPLSSEAVALKLHGNCTTTDFRGCAMTLGVFLAPAKATIVLLACMVVLVVLILIALRRWRSGLAANPWTIAGIASLSMNKDVRALFSSLPRGLRGRIEHKRLLKALGGKSFKLGYFSDQQGVPEYGIVIHQTVEPGMPRLGSKLSLYLKRSRGSEKSGAGLDDNGTKHHLPFLMLSYTWRAVFLLFLSGVLIIILYYNNTSGDTPFENFMNTQNLGVRALFTLVGIGITFYWSSFFTSLAILSPYHVLSQNGQPAQRSLLLSPPLHAIGGIWSAIRRGHAFLVIVAFTSIIAEFMPILLNNVPFRLTQTYTTHTVCTWLAVGILCFMWLVVFGSFFVSWPHMPVDPSTIAGAMYYVCDSQMLASFEGLSVLPKAERNRKVCEMGAKFRFGQMRGASGVRRLGVDRVYGPARA